MSGLFLLLGIAIIITSKEYGDAVAGTAIGSGVWPMILAGFLIFLALVQALKALIGKRSDTESPIHFAADGMKRVYLFCGILLVFVALLLLFGFYPAIAVLVILTLLVMGERRIYVIAGLIIGVLVFVWLVFGLFLGLKLPHGIII